MPYTLPELPMSEDDEHEVWGWEVFFYEVPGTIRSIMREYGIASESYSIERLSICVQTVSSVMDYLEQHASDLSSADGAVVVQYVQELSKLATLVRKLVGYWETYLHQINQRNESTAYRTPVVHIPGRRGRPTLI